MTPLTTLRTAQLFQISWPRISSIVGNLMGSIWGFSTSLGFTEPFEVALSESSAIVKAQIQITKSFVEIPKKNCTKNSEYYYYYYFFKKHKYHKISNGLSYQYRIVIRSSGTAIAAANGAGIALEASFCGGFPANSSISRPLLSFRQQRRLTEEMEKNENGERYRGERSRS